MEQLRQFRKGLKETGLLPLLKERPEVLNVVFPRASQLRVTPEVRFPLSDSLTLCSALKVHISLLSLKSAYHSL